MSPLEPGWDTNIFNQRPSLSGWTSRDSTSISKHKVTSILPGWDSVSYLGHL